MIDNNMDPMHGAYLHAVSHSMAEGPKDAEFEVIETNHGLRFQKKGQDSINFDWENYLTQAQSQISTLEFIISLALTAITAYALKKVYVRFGQTLSNRSVLGNTFVPISMTTMLIITIVK